MIVEAAEAYERARPGALANPRWRLDELLKQYGVLVARALIAEGYSADFKLASNERPEGTPS